MKRILVLSALLALLVAGAASGALGPNEKGGTEPRCAIKDPDPPRLLTVGGVSFLAGEFRNRCLDPVEEMGSFACLLEYEYGDTKTPRYVSCHSNLDRPVLVTPHETSLYITAICDYTSIKRLYQISGYGWAISVTGVKYKSLTEKSKFGLTSSSGGSEHQCHISKKNVEWREQGK